MLIQLKERLQQLLEHRKSILANKRPLLMQAAQSAAFNFDTFVDTFLGYSATYIAARNQFVATVVPNIDAQAISNEDKAVVKKIENIRAVAIKYFADNEQNLNAHKKANPADAISVDGLFATYDGLKKDAATPNTYMEEGIRNTDERYKDSPLLPDSDGVGEEYADPELNKKDNYAYQNFDTTPLTDESGMNEDDVAQGDLGDCYALSTIAALVRDKDTKELLSKNITKVKENVYEVIVYVKEIDAQGKPLGRKPKKVRVDTDFPVNSEGKVVYAQLQNNKNEQSKNELWVAILEKAYAKAMGGYDNINVGKGIEALEVFTGKTAQKLSIDVKQASEIIPFVKGLRVGIFQTKEGASKQLFWQLSPDRILYCHHAYSFQGFDPVKEVFALRNPHGKEHIVVSKAELLTHFSCIAKL